MLFSIIEEPPFIFSEKKGIMSMEIFLKTVDRTPYRW